MTLTDFEQHLDQVILERGRDYYQSGLVGTPEPGERGWWEARVEGSEAYRVHIQLSPAGEVLEATCDCPYEWGPHCKHIAAVLFALRDVPNPGAVKSGPKEPDLEALLRGLDKDALAKLLLGYAMRYPAVEDDLRMRLAPSDQLLERARKLIQHSIKAATRRHFVAYGDVDTALEGAEQVLELAGELPEVMGKASLHLLVLEEMRTLQDMCDDSGEVGMIVHNAIAGLGGLAEDLTPDSPHREALFSAILEEAQHSRYNGWDDWRDELLLACAPLCDAPDRREQLEDFLEQQARAVDNSGSRRYRAGELEKLRYTLIHRWDGEEDAWLYLEENLHNSSFRRAVIDKAMQGGDLDRALALCLEGEAADGESERVVHGWKVLRYSIYERQNNTDGLRGLAEEFLLGGDATYYPKLKALIPAEEWPEVLARLLERLEQGSWRTQEAYLEVLIGEGHAETLLQLCKQNVELVTRLYPHLVPRYGEEVASLFQFYIAHMAKASSDRKAYRQVCGLIKVYHKACGIKGARAARDKLLQEYPRRPAFLDELGKLRL